MKLITILTLLPFYAILLLNCTNNSVASEKEQQYGDFIFVRHGQADWRCDYISKEPRDLPLNALGYGQAYETALKLREGILNRDSFGDTIIFSSPLCRVRGTAEIFTDCFLTPLPITIISELRERYYGSYRHFQPDEALPGDIRPDQEPIEAFQTRIRTSLQEIQQRIKLASAKIAIIFSHHSVFQYLSQWLAGESLTLEHGGIAYFMAQDNQDKGYAVKIY